MSSRERLLILFGPEGVEELTNEARHSLRTVEECYYDHQNDINQTVSFGQWLGVLPTEGAPTPLAQKARDVASLELEKASVLDAAENFLKNLR